MPAVKDGTPALKYETFQDSRQHLSDVFDAAQEGLLVSMSRGRSNRDRRQGPVGILKITVLRDLLERVLAGWIEVSYNDEDRLHTVGVKGLPLAAEGETLSEAFDDLVDEIRDYNEQWVERLRFAPNHEGNLPLVYLAQTMPEDDDLHAWLMAQAGA